MQKKKYAFILVLLLVYVCAVAQQASYIDSLVARATTISNDTERVKLLNKIATTFNSEGYPRDSALQYAEAALELSNKLNFGKGQTGAYLNIGRYYKNKGDNEKALDNFLKALNIAENVNDKAQLGDIYDVMGNFYRKSMKNYAQALEYTKKGLEMRRSIGNKHSTAISSINVGNIYYEMDSNKLALSYFIAGLNTLKSLKADTLKRSKHSIEAQKNTEADVENNIGSVYADLKEYDKAIEYYNQALLTYEELKSEEGTAITDENIGNIYNMKGDVEEGTKYLEQSLAIARKIHAKDVVAAAYSFLAEGNSKIGKYDKAFEYQLALTNLKDSIFSEESAKQVNDMQVKYDTEKKEKENQILALTVNKQKIITYAVLFGLMLVMGLAFFVYRNYRIKQKANVALEEKNKIIEEKNKDILDSINYAKRIQSAILTTDKYLKEMLGEHFVLYKPRDVVSGDFYWCHSHGDRIIFTVADCTGHGVPGAFMSMIGNSLLNEIVVEKQETDAAKILDQLRANLLKTLQPKGQQTITRDGMDISLCVWNKKTNELQFAAANNPIYFVRKNGASALSEDKKIKVHGNNVYEVMPDKQPIGFMEEKMNNPFSSFTIKLAKGDTIYLTSDGYADQFGGEADKKFTKKKFRDMLASFNEEPLETQKAQLEKVFDQWQGNNSQTDDICI
ncbi:MAG TPA: tetratricopeptide repeat protein, partial [Bacteroidia bacterium]|nr:tetratricopeptide repeat protein [Bacteroidia bacterium]